MPRDILNFINGQYVRNASGKTFEKRTPIDGSLVGTVWEAGQPEVDAAVEAARAALEGDWGRLPVNERLTLVDAVADGINRRFDDFLARIGQYRDQRDFPAREGVSGLVEKAARPKD